MVAVYGVSAVKPGQIYFRTHSVPTDPMLTEVLNRLVAGQISAAPLRKPRELIPKFNEGNHPQMIAADVDNPPFVPILEIVQ